MPTNTSLSITRKKVVITGMGTVSSIGCSLTDVKESLKSGKSGIVHLEDRKRLGFRIGLSGTIKNFVSKYLLDRRYRKTLPEFGIWAWDAICQAMGHAGLEHQELAGNYSTTIWLNFVSFFFSARYLMIFPYILQIKST